MITRGLFVYILKCSDGSYYTGVTNNVEKRFVIHNLGLNPEAYTHSRRPVELVWCNFFDSAREAIFWEKKIKGWTRKKKEALIEDKFELLPELSECKNKTHYKNKLIDVSGKRHLAAPSASLWRPMERSRRGTCVTKSC